MKVRVSAVASVCEEVSPGAIGVLVPLVLPMLIVIAVPTPPLPE